MGQITTLFVHKVVGVAMTAEGCDDALRRELLQSVGVDPDSPVDAKLMIDDTDYYNLCARVSRELGFGPSLTVRVGSTMKCDDYGAFGLAWKSAVNLRGSYGRAERYARVLTSVSTYQLVSDPGKNYMMLNREGPRHLGMRLSNEQTIVAVAQISREVCQKDFYPEAVFFQHQAPSDISVHEDYFQCPVYFGADKDALQVSEDFLVCPNKLGDPTISKFFDAHMEKELAELSEDIGLEKRVRIQISQSLSEGIPTVSEIAGRLGMSGRSLQRRLSEQGRAYQDIVDIARRELSEKLLKETDYSLTEVAFLTGYSEQSTFTRAFKRWKGQTPRSYRLEVQPLSG